MGQSYCSFVKEEKMSNLVSILIFIVILTTVALLTIKLIKAKNQLSVLKVQIISNIQEIQALKTVAERSGAGSIESSDGFVKFITDSRNWAFSYIEEVQAGLQQFFDETEHDVKYFEEYGILFEGHALYKAMTKFLEEYNKLKGLLPEKEDK